jgi:hypothetical protein
LGLRHPWGIYSLSATHVAEALESVIDSLDGSLAAAAPLDGAFPNALTRATDHLVGAITEHYDDCRSIVRIVFEEDGSKLQDRATRDFTEATRAGRSFFAQQANAIKHRQGRIRLIKFHTPTIIVPGYYIEGVNDQGALGPSPFVHGGRRPGCYSFTRTIRMAVATVLLGSTALSSGLKRKLSESRGRPEGFGPLAGLLPRIVAAAPRVFPDEGASQLIDIDLGACRAKLNAPSNRKWWAYPPAGAEVAVSIPGDGVTRSFTLPYFGKDPRKP